ncbi:MAG TPA: response regulator [Nitrospiraceae bacterium]|nr:response regulator [Nitrospiraceae bacterium]
MTNQKVEILLVEDNEDDIVIIQEVFADMNLASIVNTVRDGEEALAYLWRKGKYKVARMPDIVLLDINMPKKNGFEVLEEMKKDPRLQSLPVIMLTTSHREEDVVRSYEKGACSYIHKLVDLDQFKQLIKQFEHYWTGISRVPLVRE